MINLETGLTTQMGRADPTTSQIGLTRRPRRPGPARKPRQDGLSWWCKQV